MDSLLLDRDQDLSLLPVLLLPLPNDFGLLPDTGLGQRSVSADGLSWWNHVRLLFLHPETCPGRGLLMHAALHRTRGISR